MLPIKPNEVEEIKEKIRRVIKKRLNGASFRSKNKNRDYELTPELVFKKYIEQKGICPVTKFKMTFDIHDDNVISPDRMNNNIGYTDENTRIVTARVNKMMLELPDEEFLCLVKKIADNN